MKEKIQSEKRERMRIFRILKRQSVSGICVSPGYQTHEQLWQIVRKLPSDFGPYGQVKRETICDCSSGCRWFHVLAGSRSRDWGVCANQQSPRAGLLTFEHQGCLQFASPSITPTAPTRAAGLFSTVCRISSVQMTLQSSLTAMPSICSVCAPLLEVRHAIAGTSAKKAG